MFYKVVIILYCYYLQHLAVYNSTVATPLIFSSNLETISLSENTVEAKIY